MEQCILGKSGRLGKSKRNRSSTPPMTRVARVGSVEIYSGTWGDGALFIECTLTGCNDIVMYIDLEEEYKNKAPEQFYSVSMVEVARQFTGQGLAPKVYRAIMRATGIKIISGAQQSKGGQSIWRQLISAKGMRLMAYRHTKNIPRCLREVEPCEYTGDIKADSINLWSDSDYNNWRLVAEYTGA